MAIRAIALAFALFVGAHVAAAAVVPGCSVTSTALSTCVITCVAPYTASDIDSALNTATSTSVGCNPGDAYTVHLPSTDDVCDEAGFSIPSSITGSLTFDGSGSTLTCGSGKFMAYDSSFQGSSFNVKDVSFWSNGTCHGSYYYGRLFALDNNNPMSISFDGVNIEGFCNYEYGSVYLCGHNKTLTITNGEFKWNTASSGGDGGIFYIDVCHGSSITIDRISAVGNHAECGGVIYNDCDAPTTISNSEFKDNWVSSDGGAVYSYYAPTVFYNISAVNNSAVSDGGFYYSDYAPTWVSIANFEENSACYGGALYIYESDVEVTEVRFARNRATDGGAGIYVDYGNEARVKDVIATGNYAECGALISTYCTPNVTITNVVASDNRVNDDGGVVNVCYGDVKIEKVEMDNNWAVYGGAIYVEYGSLDLSYGTFTNNTARDYAGAVYTYYAPTWIEEAIFRDNRAVYDYGGALYFEDNAASVSNANFVGNAAEDNDGGAIYSCGNYELNLDNVFMSGNWALDNGGAIYTEGTTNVTNSYIRANWADYGGAIATDCAHLSIWDTDFAGNTALSYGGALYVYDGHVDMYGGEMTCNQAGHGGAAYIKYRDSNFTHVVFNSNNATSGGVFMTYENRLNVSESVFINNQAALEQPNICLGYESQVGFTEDVKFVESFILSFTPSLKSTTYYGNCDSAFVPPSSLVVHSVNGVTPASCPLDFATTTTASSTSTTTTTSSSASSTVTTATSTTATVTTATSTTATGTTSTSSSTSDTTTSSTTTSSTSPDNAASTLASGVAAVAAALIAALALLF